MLLTYALAVCDECDRRGIADNVNQRQWFLDRVPAHTHVTPPWLDDPEVFLKVKTSHRSSLVAKFRDHYLPQFPDVPEFTDYYWPVPEPSKNG